ncbi:hypothetical protein LTR84_002447 [Exophiala bonariae]|uniref:FAS1 domain-containing protein n=1 Tax=Exophiala bonariae TaxID=1690606 RepID=A0AAV9ND64_9EURO|nr:hypothetical protein LTR84_002447 [Exophiala bonariae]
MLRNLWVLSALAASAAAQAGGSFPSLLALVNETDGFSYLNTYLQSFPEVRDSVTALTNITVFAPSNKALLEFAETPRYSQLTEGGADFLQALLSYHILDGIYDNITEYGPLNTLLTSPRYTNLTAGQVIFAYYNPSGFEIAIWSGNDSQSGTIGLPYEFEGGILYPINSVFNIPGTVSEEVSGPLNGSSFAQALDQAGLTDEVNALKDATFFVPKNDGWESVSQSLSALSPEALVDVLKYHIVPDFLGYYSVLEEANGTTLKTLSGQELTVYLNEAEEMFINGAGVTYVDVPAANGVIVFIDNVLNPTGTVQPPTSDAEDGVPAFPTGVASSGSGGESTSSTTTASVATYTGAASALQTGTMSLLALVGAVMMAIVL